MLLHNISISVNATFSSSPQLQVFNFLKKCCSTTSAYLQTQLPSTVRNFKLATFERNVAPQHPHICKHDFHQQSATSSSQLLKETMIHNIRISVNTTFFTSPQLQVRNILKEMSLQNCISAIAIFCYFLKK
jgi:hypothetical protein